MSYRVLICKPARKFIEKQSPEQQKRILAALYKLPHEGDISTMKGCKNRYRLRIGGYRAVFNLYNDMLMVEVIKVDNRGGVYKN